MNIGLPIVLKNIYCLAMIIMRNTMISNTGSWLLYMCCHKKGKTDAYKFKNWVAIYRGKYCIAIINTDQRFTIQNVSLIGLHPSYFHHI